MLYQLGSSLKFYEEAVRIWKVLIHSFVLSETCVKTVIVNNLMDLTFNLTFVGPGIANIISEYNQQDATFLNLFISVRRSGCFRRFFRPSSGAQNCTYSIRYLSDRYCDLLLALGGSNGLTNTWCCMCSFELLMMDGKTVWNMQSVLQK